MCNRYTPSRGEDAQFDLFGRQQVNLPPDPFWRPRTIGPFGMGYFVRQGREPGTWDIVEGQWGMIRPGAPERRERIEGTKRYKSTNNARSETMHRYPTFAPAWKAGRRCIIPAIGYDEPLYQEIGGKSTWWTVCGAGGREVGLAGLWSEWTDPASGEVVPNYTMVTVDVSPHPLLRRFHKLDEQERRGVVPLASEHWMQWLLGTSEEALSVLHPLAADRLEAQPAEAPTKA
jgi:putative SOS response-associated peptidase YedK